MKTRTEHTRLILSVHLTPVEPDDLPTNVEHQRDVILQIEELDGVAEVKVKNVARVD